MIVHLSEFQMFSPAENWKTIISAIIINDHFTEFELSRAAETPVEVSEQTNVVFQFFEFQNFQVSNSNFSFHIFLRKAFSNIAV